MFTYREVSKYIVMSAEGSSYGSSAELVHAHTAVLAGLDPDAPLDDLDSLAELSVTPESAQHSRS
jgi:hypothetical protein